MIFNYVFEFLCWLAGVIHVLGCFGGLFAFVAIYWLLLSKRGKNLRTRLRFDDEYRCSSCADEPCCDALCCGMVPLFPCSNYCNKKNKPD